MLPVLPLHGELELAAGLENLVPFRRLTHLGLDIEQTIANLHVRLAGVHGKEIGLRRHLARFLQDGLRLPHLLLYDVDHTLPENSKFCAGGDFCSLFSGSRHVLGITLWHFIPSFQ